VILLASSYTPMDYWRHRVKYWERAWQSLQSQAVITAACVPSGSIIWLWLLAVSCVCQLDGPSGVILLTKKMLDVEVVVSDMMIEWQM
jgi:hypothetical protein